MALNSSSYVCGKEVCKFPGATCILNSETYNVSECETIDGGEKVCQYHYGCYIMHAEGPILTVVVLLGLMYTLLLVYTIYLLRKDLFSKKRLVDKLDDITLIVCVTSISLHNDS